MQTIAILVSLLAASQVLAACVDLPTPSFCHGIVSYQISDAKCPNSSLGVERNLPLSLLGAVSAACRTSLSQYVCGKAWESCDGTSAPPPAVCGAITSACTSENDLKVVALIQPVCDASSSQTFSSNAVADAAVDRCASYDTSLTFCADLIDYPVFLPAGETLASLDAQLATAKFAVESFADPCKTALRRFACAGVFKRCDTDAAVRVNSSAPQIALPRSPCPALCQAAVDSCPAVLSSQINCQLQTNTTQTCAKPATSSFNFSDYSKFAQPLAFDGSEVAKPLHTCCFDFETANATSCIAQAQELDPLNNNIQSARLLSGGSGDGGGGGGAPLPCPYPLIKRSSPTSPPFPLEVYAHCNVPCQALLFTPKQWEAAYAVDFAISLISTIVSILLVTTWYVQDRQKVWTPLFWFGVSVCIYMLNMTAGFFVGMASDPIPGLHPWAGNICKSSTEAYGSNDNGWCKVQSTIFLYVVSVACLYMSTVIFDALYNIHSMTRLTKEKRKRLTNYYVCVCSVRSIRHSLNSLSHFFGLIQRSTSSLGAGLSFLSSRILNMIILVRAAASPFARLAQITCGHGGSSLPASVFPVSAC